MKHGGKNLNLTDPNTGEWRKFGVIVGAVLIAIGVFPLLKGKELKLYLIFLGGLLSIVALIRPALLDPINKIWLRAGHLLGRINSFIILSVIFYLFFTPARLLLGIFSKEKKFAFKLSRNSYWIRRNKETFRETMKRQF
jgi:hypothetical protein